MAIIKILGETVVLLVSSTFQMIGVFTGGAAKLFRKITEYLNCASTWLNNRLETRKRKDKDTVVNDPV